MTDQQAPPPTTPAPPPAESPPAAPPPAPPAASAAPASPAAPSMMSNLMSSLSLGEQLLLGGSLLMILGDLVFDVFLDYSFADTAWLAAVVTLVLVALHMRPQKGLSVPDGAYRLALIVLGVVAAFSGIRWLLFDLQAFSGRLSATFLLGALAFYVAVALMAVGAFQVWRRSA